MVAFVFDCIGGIVGKCTFIFRFHSYFYKEKMNSYG